MRQKEKNRLLRRHKDTLRPLRDLDVRVEDIDVTGASHIKLTLVHAGETRKFFMALTPSCSRAGKNFLETVRRWVTEAACER